MNNVLKRQLLMQEVQNLEGAAYIWEMRCKAAQKVNNKEKADACEKELAEVLGQIKFYEDELRGLVKEKTNGTA
jgi:hypothetical protein